MQQELLILPVVLPIIFWAAYHYHKDRHLPEPAGNLLLCFALGLVAAGISKALYLGLEPLGLRMDAVALGEDQPLALLAYAVLAIGPIEEFAKFLPFVIVVLRFEHFDEPLDGIIYASFIALGYAAVENLYYLQFLTVPEAIARGFVGPVIHVLFASIWAYWITRAHLARRSSVRAALLGLLLSSGLHGVYDFLLKPINLSSLVAKMQEAIEANEHSRK
ncbi:MAG: PrsW family intramembrane metalloprotease [Woeseiaceae bacterium]